jgi:aerobic C4-dicarboxylate transport protein
MLFGMLGGIAFGAAAPVAGAALKPLGDLFIAAVKVFIGPIIFTTIVSGICGVREMNAVGRIAAKALAYFLVLSAIALVFGLVTASILQPGAGMHVRLTSSDSAAVADYIAKAHTTSLLSMLLHIVPSTMISAFTDGDILQILLVSIVFGAALVAAGERADRLSSLIADANAVLFRCVELVMRLAPLGAFCAMAFTVGRYGIHALAGLAALVISVYGASALFVLVVLGLVARLHGFHITRLIGALKSELLLVLGTSSSEAALPGLMEKLEKLGCPRSIVGLVVPAGYSFNLDGTALYLSLAAMFIAQATGTPLKLTDELLILAVAMVSSKGAAAVSGGGFIALAATLSVVPGIPIAGLALILGVDRLLSECRALTNLIGNAVAAFVIAAWEGADRRTFLRSNNSQSEPSDPVPVWDAPIHTQPFQ